MKKWEQQHIQRLHQKKIHEAKPTLSFASSYKSPSDLKSPSSGQKTQISSCHSNHLQLSSNHSYFGNTPRDSHSSQISDYFEFEKQDLSQIPLYRILKHFNLQQYAKALISRGFGYDLSKLAALGKTELDQLMLDIKMMPGHRVKLIKLTSQVNKICYEIMEHDDVKQFRQSFFNRATSLDASKPKTASAMRSQSGPKVDARKPEKKPSTSVSERKPLAGHKNNQVTGTKRQLSTAAAKKPSVAKNSKVGVDKKLERIGFDFFSDSQQSMDDEFSRVLDNILEKYQVDSDHGQMQVQPLLLNLHEEKENNSLLQRINYSQSENLKCKLQHAFNQINSTPSDLDGTLIRDDDASTVPMTNEKSDTVPTCPDDFIERSSKSSTKENPKSRSYIKETPDIQVEEEIEEKIEHVARARTLDLIEKKLDANHLNMDQLNMEFRKIKDLYSSFDGAKMTSTIANLDIEEMSYCLACAIQKHVDYFLEAIYPNRNFLLPQMEADPKKEYEIRQLRYNFYNQKGNIFSSTEIDMAEAKGKAQDDLLIETAYGHTPKIEAQLVQAPTRQVKEIAENIETGVQVGKDGNVQRFILDNNILCNNEDDEVLHNESAGVIEVEEGYGQGEGIEKFDSGYISLERNYMSCDPYTRKNLDIITERSYEMSRNTVKTIESLKRKAQHVAEEEPQEEGTNEELEGFLRKSLKDSLLLNIKHEKEQEASSHHEDNRGFMKLYPVGMVDTADLQTQVMNGVSNGAHERPSNFNNNGEFTYEKGGNCWTEFSMEESVYTELELDNQNTDIAERIRNVFERTYNEKNLTPEEYNKKIQYTVEKDLVSSFCKNVILKTKMEKEVVILSLIYIERLIIRTNMYLNAVNWKRLTFAALVLASKIWDDESFENENFAKAFPQYTTKEINELERVFLEFLDYDLMINGTEYAKYYFVLRTFAEKNKKSFPLRAIDLQTVRLLQKRAIMTSKNLKEIYAEPMNRTFS